MGALDDLLAEAGKLYEKREFCKALFCPVQGELDRFKEGSKDYERIRKACKTDCIYTAHDFHKWLIEQGYLIVKPREE